MKTEVRESISGYTVLWQKEGRIEHCANSETSVQIFSYYTKRTRIRTKNSLHRARFHKRYKLRARWSRQIDFELCAPKVTTTGTSRRHDSSPKAQLVRNRPGVQFISVAICQVGGALAGRARESSAREKKKEKKTVPSAYAVTIRAVMIAGLENSNKCMTDAQK